ncbi:recombinase family protein [Serpentinicella alkaliphila]|uniref:DNA invertase Pin-like site-specific DNA recombinase n=1 Tax=Serpentinicella alkaliphila TaxID=1734049 RepID=A0A4R2TZQ7_9FIRM|nr:recombinase family protein [Serpentinicella alkaliphila]QUH25195.1 recombinase family protein [Serpentinicella alkaliphila]TCQ07005.1 DNA invertase Pin-like site-specific DNA recombinase [Serpentinicella alkaliphila]
MDFGYCRCSTNETKQDIDRQRRELRKLGIKNENIYWEYVSGSKDHKVEWNRLLSVVECGSTIACTEVSRLTRSTKQLCEIIETARAKQIKLIIGTFVVDCTSELDPMTQGMLLMWGVFSEMEKSIISQRVRSGMANAASKGIVVGRPTTTIENLPNSFLRHYPKYTNKEINVTELARLCDVSRQTIYKYISIYKSKEENKDAVMP